MKKTTAFTLAALVALVGTVVGCATNMAPVSMRGSDVAAADQAPEAKVYSTRTPGSADAQLITRTFSTQPPLIPHTVEKYEPITADENACLECHISDELRGKKMPKMGKSHFSTTVKDAEGMPAVEMTRFQCNTCHVAQVDAKELVENTFVGNK